jgi:hypothetical protein
MFSQCAHQPGKWGGVQNCVHGTAGYGSVEGPGKLVGYDNKPIYSGPASAGAFALEHKIHADAIRGEKKLWKKDSMNYGWNGAYSSFTACLGRYACQSGKEISWDDAVAKGRTAMPTDTDGVFDMENADAKAPIMPDADGFYENSVAKAGEFNPFEK